jgi:hypothetical protein
MSGCGVYAEVLADTIVEEVGERNGLKDSKGPWREARGCFVVGYEAMHGWAGQHKDLFDSRSVVYYHSSYPLYTGRSFSSLCLSLLSA